MKKLNIVILIGSLLMSACGGGTGDPSGSSPSLKPPIGDISGDWNIVDTQLLINNSCSDAKFQKNKYRVSLVQNGNSVTLSGYKNGVAYSFKGILSGNKLTYSGKSDNNTTGTAVVTINTNCNTITTGRTDWVFDNGFVVCSGYTSLNGSRVSKTGCGKTGTLNAPEIFFIMAKFDGKSRNVVNIKWKNPNTRKTTTVIERSLNDESNYQKVDYIDLSTPTLNKAKVLNLPPKTLVYFRLYYIDLNGARSPNSYSKYVTTL